MPAGGRFDRRDMAAGYINSLEESAFDDENAVRRRRSSCLCALRSLSSPQTPMQMRAQMVELTVAASPMVTQATEYTVAASPMAHSGD